MGDKRPSLESVVDDTLLAPLRHPSADVIELLGHNVAMTTISLAHVSDAFSNFAPLRNVTVGGVVECFLVHHEERDAKGENGLIYCDLHGRRKDANAATACAVVFDLDGWRTYESVVEQRERQGYVGATWTTHNHGKTESEEDASGALDWRGGSPIRPFTDAEMAAYLAHKGKGYVTGIRVENGGNYLKNDDGKIVYRMRHDPIAKVRTIYFLDMPLPYAEVGKDGWRAVYSAMGQQDFPDQWDTQCVNIGRIHWCPSHRSGAPHAVEIHTGVLRPWQGTWASIKAEVERKRETIRARQSQALRAMTGDLAEIAHYLRYISPDCGRSDWTKVLSTIHRETGGNAAGLALAHEWSAGSPAKYEPEALDSYWQWLTDNADGMGYTLGSLVWMAKRTPAFAPYLRRAPLRKKPMTAVQVAEMIDKELSK